MWEWRGVRSSGDPRQHQLAGCSPTPGTCSSRRPSRRSWSRWRLRRARARRGRATRPRWTARTTSWAPASTPPPPPPTPARVGGAAPGAGPRPSPATPPPPPPAWWAPAAAAAATTTPATAATATTPRSWPTSRAASSRAGRCTSPPRGDSTIASKKSYFFLPFSIFRRHFLWMEILLIRFSSFSQRSGLKDLLNSDQFT